MIMGHSRTFGNPFYMRCKKHFCTKCGHQLIVKKASKVVNSKSSEAKNFEGDVRPFGDIKFIWDAFYCSNCDLEISIKEMRQIEGVKDSPWAKITIVTISITFMILIIYLIYFTN